MDVQRNLEANVEKKTKDTFGPPPGWVIKSEKSKCMSSFSFSRTGKKLVIFIDDMNMPQVDTYGTQQPIALLKLLLEKRGMYDRSKDLNWKTIKDIFIIAAMGKVNEYLHTRHVRIAYSVQAGGGRNEVDPRFMSLFSVFNVTFPSSKSLHLIYSSIITGHLIPFNEGIGMFQK